MYTTTICCDSESDHQDQPRFDLQKFLPGTIFTEPPLNNNSSNLNKRKKSARTTVYRPVKERVALDFRLIQWLQTEHLIDDLRAVRPIYHILSLAQRLTLVRAQSKDIQKPLDVTRLIGESIEWAAEWEEKVFSVIQVYDRDLAVLEERNRKQKADTRHQSKRQKSS